MSEERRDARLGDVYWLTRDEQDGAELRPPHPHVVIQAETPPQGPVRTMVVCALTTNLKRAKEPGNVLLESGEANLPRQSIVVASQAFTVEKTELGEYIGSLTPQRVDQIWAGIRFLERMTDHHSTR